MKISVKVKPKNKCEYIKKIGVVSFEIAVKEVPENGKANRAVINALAEFLNLPASSVGIISGQTSKQKVLEIAVTLEELEKLPDSPGQIKLL